MAPQESSNRDRDDRDKSRDDARQRVSVQGKSIEAGFALHSDKMAFGGARGGMMKKAGKRGMRQNDGRKKMSNVKLRPVPAPAAPQLDNASNSHKRVQRDGHHVEPQPDEDTSGEEGQDEDEESESDSDELNYTVALHAERKPLVGCNICVTGCADYKRQLLASAKDLGADTEGILSKWTTHLIADASGSPKFDVSPRTFVQQGSRAHVKDADLCHDCNVTRYPLRPSTGCSQVQDEDHVAKLDTSHP